MRSLSTAALRRRYMRGGGGGWGQVLGFLAVAVLVCAFASTGARTITHAGHPASPRPHATVAHAAAGAGSGPTAAQFIHLEESKRGAPYVYGAIGPTEFDCSGLVFWALHQLGDDTAARTSEAQYAWTHPVSYSNLKPGDLIFEQWPGDPDPSPGHVVTYIGGGQVVEAPHSGATVQVRAWSPSETTIVGYGQIPGLRY
jgi:cell wall-associated NlpC family hydrolase